MNDRILLAHGSGGKLSHQLISEILMPELSNPLLAGLDDAAVFDFQGRAAFTTDSFVVTPLFFPGGDIGKLAVCGTVNDLAAMGARPLYLSLGLIIEEGFRVEDLQKVLRSLRRAADEAGVKIATGDTKVVNRGSADQLFINTSGLGIIPPGVALSGAGARPGDRILISGSIGDHGVAVMAQRENLRFKIPVESDCAPLNGLVSSLVDLGPAVRSDLRCLRDPTRGGLATTLNEIAAQSRVGMRLDETAIPVKAAVTAACEMLGLEPLYLANEGKMIVICGPDSAGAVLRTLRGQPYGAEAAVIGEVTAEHPGRVVLRTALGASRIVDMLSGELLPRIC